MKLLNIKWLSSFFLVALGLMVALNACKKDDDDAPDIVGKWLNISTGDSIIVTINKDNSIEQALYTKETYMGITLNVIGKLIGTYTVNYKDSTLTADITKITAEVPSVPLFNQTYTKGTNDWDQFIKGDDGIAGTEDDYDTRLTIKFSLSADKKSITIISDDNSNGIFDAEEIEYALIFKRI